MSTYHDSMKSVCCSHPHLKKEVIKQTNKQTKVERGGQDEQSHGMASVCEGEN